MGRPRVLKVAMSSDSEGEYFSAKEECLNIPHDEETLEERLKVREGTWHFLCPCHKCYSPCTSTYTSPASAGLRSISSCCKEILFLLLLLRSHDRKEEVARREMIAREEERSREMLRKEEETGA